MIGSQDLDVFLKGEICDLCIPTDKFALESDWYSLFNNERITKYLDQGKIPNTPKKQLDFLRDETEKGRIILIISDKCQYIGVISLSKIDLEKSCATIAIVLDSQKNQIKSPFIGIEAISLLTTHGFDKIGLNRIESGHHENLFKWQITKEIIGFQFEGLSRCAFKTGNQYYNVIKSAIVRDDFEAIKKARGKLWDNFEMMKNRIRAHKEENKNPPYLKYISQSVEIDKYYEKLYRL